MTPTPTPSTAEVVIPIIADESNHAAVKAFGIAVVLVALVFALARRGR